MRTDLFSCVKAGAVVLLTSFLLYPAKAEARMQDPERVMEQLGRSASLYRDLSKRQAEKYDVVFRRDPMRPLVDAQGQPIVYPGARSGVFVQGIIWSDEKPLAVIDDELYKEGDMIGPYKIIKIEPDGLLAQNGEEILRVSLDRGLDTTQ